MTLIAGMVNFYASMDEKLENQDLQNKKTGRSTVSAEFLNVIRGTAPSFSGEARLVRPIRFHTSSAISPA